MVDGKEISSSNYASLFNSIQLNTAHTLRLQYRRQTDGQSYAATLNKAPYTPTTVIHSSILDIEETNKRIGYLVYTGFETDYDTELLAALEGMAAEGVEELILDLRSNGGGSLSSTVKLTSALLPAEYEGKTLCTIKRNPKNKVAQTSSDFTLKDTGTILNLRRLTVICSGYSASASELVIMGLRGLDIPVMLIGAPTQGKNCGMDVTRRTIDGINVEFAPITFMCFNAKGFGGWGEGITPDIDLTAEDNTLGVHDANYPLPRADWGDYNHDIALAAALSHVTGKSISQSTRSHMTEELPIVARIEPPMEGIRVYVEE
jgi:C-terminal processing protease CtpA/Prc